MSLNAGTIEYTVSVETQQSIDAANKINASLDETEKQMLETDAASKQLNTSLTKLAKSIGVVIAASALKDMARLVQSYQEMAERVQQATSSQAEFEMVQKRLLDTANGTYRSLEEAQELYIRTADSLRSMGYSTQQALDITDSMSYAFVTNAASADRAAAATSAFSKSMNTGKVAADQWETITSAIPSVINAIADSSGKSAAEIRALGAAGKLTASDLSEGLRNSLEAVSATADGMANNLVDAGVRSRTALTQVLVALENQTGGLQALTDGIITAADAMLEFGTDAEKMEAFLKLATVAGASLASVMAGRVVVSLAASAKGFYTNVIAARAAAVSAVQAAQAATILAAQNLITARAAEAAAVGLGHHAAAARALAVADTQARAAVDALTAAQSRLNGMMTLGARAAGFLRTGLAFLGGPLGVALLAATALYTLSSSAKDVTVDMANLKAPLNDVVEALQKLDTIARDTELRNMRKGVQELETAYKALGKGIEGSAAYAKSSLSTMERTSVEGQKTVELLDAIQEAGSNAAKGIPQEFDKLYESIKDNTTISTEFKESLLTLVSNLSAAGNESAAAAIQYDNVANAAAGMGQEANAAASAVDNLNESLRTGSSAASEYTQKLGRALEDKIDNSAVGRLSRDIRDNAEAWSTATKAEFDAAYAAAAASDAYDAQQKKLKKTTTARKGLTEAQREAKKAEDDAKRGAESNTRAIDDLRESISQTALKAGELAARQAELRLNQYATPEQIALIRELGAELYDINELQRKQDAFGKDVGGKIRGDVPVLQGGGFDDGTARYEAEAEAERQRYAEQLERMVEAEELKLEVAGGYDAMREQLYQEHSDRMAEIDRVRTDMQLTQWAQGFGDMSKGLADFANTFAKENKAMFAVSKAAAIAQAVINTYQAATAAMSAMSAIPIVGPALGIVAAAAAVAGGMAQVANIRSQTMGGGRRYGGAVNDNKYYRVNEDGRPEIFKGSDGNQYMMPNQRGEVVSHDDATAGAQRAGNTVNVTQNITMRSDNGNYTARQVMLESSQRQAIAEARLG